MNCRFLRVYTLCVLFLVLAGYTKNFLNLMNFISIYNRSPAVSRIRAKMLYATSKDRFRRELDGVHYELQATDPSELDIDILRERAH